MSWFRENRRSVGWFATAVGCGVVGIVYFYRGFFLGEPTMLQGNVGDGALTMFISNHWSTGTMALNPWRDLGFFYPTPDTLGYSDTMFLFGVFEWPMTVFGVPQPLRFQSALIAVSVVGYAGSVALLRIGPRVSWPLSIAGALVFAFGSGVYIASDHPQLLAFNFLPVAGLLAVGVRRLSSWLSGLAAVGCGLLTALIVYTAFYIGWFILLSFGLLGVLVILFEGLSRRSVLSWKKAVSRLAAFVAGLALGLVPFAYTYGPVLAQGRHRSIAETAAFGLSPGDLFNVSPSNLLWGKIVSQPGLIPAPHLGNGEFSMAPTPLLTLLAVVLGIWAARKLKLLTAWGHVGLASAAAGLLLWVAPLKVGSFFPWAETFHRLPGGEAVRAVGRVELVAGILLIFGVVILLQLWLAQRRGSGRNFRTACTALVTCVVLFEQVQMFPMQAIPIAWLDELARVPAPPAECQSFVVTHKRRADDPPFVPQNEAALVAQRLGLPTWNGYSGFTPAGWELWDVGTAKYRQQILAWGTAYGVLAHACGLNLETGSWLAPKALRAFATNDTIAQPRGAAVVGDRSRS